tara:strand:- start:391 stop:681 length:291 start_codon:yes stop_codon:yes gene_type:complete
MMKKLTSKKVRDYMSYRSSEKLRQCPEAIAAACNDMANEYADTDFAEGADALDYLRLLFFNDPIKSMCTHSYGFHTATGRALIEKLQARYYEHKTN